MEGRIDPALKKELDALQAPEGKSRLEPFKAYILRWRRQRWPWSRIRRVLAQKCGVSVAHSTLVEFVQRRMRPRLPEVPEPVPLADKSQGMFDGGWSKMTPEEKEEARRKVMAMREEARKPKPVKRDYEIVFEYDETKPLVLPPKEEWKK